MKLIAKEFLSESYDRHDIEVEDNHNFFVSGIAVHNCASRINYVQGQLYEAATRGDGQIGQDVTDNVKAMKEVPKFISGLPDVTEVRAEVIMPRSVFQRLISNGVNGANPRNLGTGSLMAQDPQVTASRSLEIKAYDLIVGNIGFKTECEKRAWMVANLPGIQLADMQVIDIDQFEAVALEWEAKRPTLDYEIDGLVVALDSIEAQQEAGWNGVKFPLGKIAYKFKPEQKTARVIGIDWQVGRTGRLTPMARIEPTLLAGSTIRNITLHNAANVTNMNVAIGDEVLIEKAGDIIPQVVRVTFRPGNRNSKVLAVRCPSCGGEIVDDENHVNLWCENIQCPAQLERRVLHWIKTLNIMGIGTGIVREMCQQGFVKDIPDIYYLNEMQLVSVTGGQSSAQKVQTALLEHSEIPLAVFLDALGIDGLGTTSSKLVAKRFGTLGNVLHATEEELDALPDIGLTTAQNIVRGLLVLTPMIDQLVKVVDVQDMVVKQGPLMGMSFVLTGAMSKGRKEIEAAIEAAGGENKGSVSKGVTYLVQADASSTSSKTEKANKCGTKIISEDTLWKIME